MNWRERGTTLGRSNCCGLEALDHDSTREQHIAGVIAAVKKKAQK